MNLEEAWRAYREAKENYEAAWRRYEELRVQHERRIRIAAVAPKVRAPRPKKVRVPEPEPFHI